MTTETHSVSHAAQVQLDHNAADVERTLNLLEWGPEVSAELRALGNREIGFRHGTISGYFDDPATMAAAAADCAGKVEGVYMVLNPVPRRLLGRASNRCRLWSKHTTSDAEVARRRWLLVDCDPTRPAGLSSTDAEHQAALDRASAVRAHLLRNGFSGLVLADSGNGGHVLVPIDWANDKDADTRAKTFLCGLARRFDDDRVKIDPTTFNAARLCKLYGTRACKGDPLPENPHRLSRILEVR